MVVNNKLKWVVVPIGEAKRWSASTKQRADSSAKEFA